MSKSRVCVALEPDLVATAAGESDAPTAARVHEHVGRCAGCRRELEGYRAIEGEVSAMRTHLLAAPHVTRARSELESRLADLRSRLVSYRVFPSPVGNILIARSEQGVVLLEYLGGRQAGASRLARLGGAEVVQEDGEVEQLARELGEYFQGRRARLDWPLDLRLVHSEFHRDVLRATASIPYGAVASYAGLAREVGRPRAVRAAAQALRWNPLPIVIPCHRVIGSSGALTGYAGGEAAKQRLLEVEGIPIAHAHHAAHVVRDAMYVLGPGEREYCLPSCPSVDPFPLGGRLFGSRQRAEAVGLVPCTACRPDLHPLAR